MNDLINIREFTSIDLDDPFFDSLKEDYREFPQWFHDKAATGARAWTTDDDRAGLQAFLYTKVEDGPVLDVTPWFPPKRRLKVGTMKIVAHGTRLGERFMKKVMDVAVAEGVDEIYVTVFAKHTGLVSLYQRYGFVDRGGKSTSNGTERVFVKDLRTIHGDVLTDYPRINLSDAHIYLLSIYPAFHTRLFPDSILKTERFDVIDDVSHTNSIHKAYLCAMNVSALRRGDVVVIYRTTDHKGPARFRSVATSVCVVEEVKHKSVFPTLAALWDYCGDYSVFSRSEIVKWFNRNSFFVIKMTYNQAFRTRTRLTRGHLIDDVGLDARAYWGFMRLTVDQCKQICAAGEIHESLIID